MEDKKQDVKSLEELLNVANEFRKWAVDFGNELSKVLADIQTSKKEEDTWEMKCPYAYGDEVYILYSDGETLSRRWDCKKNAFNKFNQCNVFPTRQAAELEAQRRNLLTRFRAFRDECNGDWKADFENPTEEKFSICFYYKEFRILSAYNANDFATFGYFKNKHDAQRAIKLFGDEIKARYVDCEG